MEEKFIYTKNHYICFYGYDFLVTLNVFDTYLFNKNEIHMQVYMCT